MEPLACGTKVEMGARHTKPMLEGVRIKVKLERRRSSVELKGWRPEVQLEALNSMLEPG